MPKKCLQGTKVVIVGKGLPVYLQGQFSYLRRNLDYFSIKKQTLCPLPIGTIGYVVGGPISSY